MFKNYKSDKTSEKISKSIAIQATKTHELMCLMACIIFPSFAWFDMYTMPVEDYWYLTIVRWSISFVILCWLIIQKKYKFNQIYLTFFATFSVSTFCAWACVVGGEQFLYQNNLAYCTVFLSASLFILWHWRFSVLIVVLSSIVYVWFTLSYNYFSIPSLMLKGGSALLTLMVLHPIIVYFRYESYKRECKLKIDLEHSNEEIKLGKQKAESRNIELFDAREKLKEVIEELKSTNANLEDVVQLRTNTLEKTNIKLKKALEDLDRFLYISYHDIKGPIARMRGLTNLLPTTLNKHEFDIISKHYYRTIEEMETLIYKLYRINHLNQMDTVKELVYLKNWIEQLCSKFTSSQIEINVTILQEVKIGIDTSVLSLILESILENSIRYKSDNRPCKIKISSQFVENNIEISVLDNGEGIDSAILDKIFTMFYRGNKKSYGHGLGLYLAKRGIEKLGGTILVVSEKDTFSELKLRFPVVLK